MITPQINEINQGQCFRAINYILDKLIYLSDLSQLDAHKNQCIDAIKPWIDAFKLHHPNWLSYSVLFDCFIEIIQRLNQIDQNNTIIQSWWLDLLEIYYSNESKINKIHKESKRPSHLYRYYNLEEFNDNDLAQLFTHIKTTNPDNYNDVFELLPPFTNPPISTLSFSSESPIRTKNAQLMIGHYTKQRHGICIEYKTMPDSARIFVCPIDYELVYGDPMTDFKNAYHPDNMLRKKFTCWEYEKEWRLIHRKPHGLEPLEKVGLKINSLFFVPNIDKKIKQILLEQCHQHTIQHSTLNCWFGGAFVTPDILYPNQTN